MDSAVIGDRALQPLDRHEEACDVTVAQQDLEQRMLGLHVEPLQRVGVGGVAGLDPLGLGQPQLVEQDDLQLLGRTQVELPAEHGVRRIRGALDLTREVGVEVVQVLRVDRDPDALHPGQDVHQRQLDVMEQPRAAPLLQVGIQDVGEVDDCLGPHDQGLGRRRVVLTVEAELTVVLGLGAELTVQEAQHQVSQVEAALAGQRKIGGQGGVAGHPAQLPPMRCDREQRALHVVHRLGPAGVAQPRSERLVVVGRDGHRVEPRTGSVAGSERESGQRPCAARPGARTGDARTSLAAGVLGKPGGDLTGLEAGDVDREPFVGLRLGRRQRGVQTVAKHPELQGVEHPVHLVAVPGTDREVVRPHRQRDITDELVDPPIEQDLSEVGLHRLSGLALELVDVVGERAEVAVLVEPLGGGLGTDPGHARQVVAALAHEGGQVRVEPGGDAVAALHLGRVDPGEVADPLAGIEHGDLVADELEGVPVPGDHCDVEALRGRLVRERGDDVVGLEALGGHHGICRASSTSRIRLTCPWKALGVSLRLALYSG